MFYSHEILSKPEHGVATVWLVANLGHNSSSRRLTRKTIEGIDVPKACDTIEHPPGAPIALRLQGNLLYGVSGVYHKHGLYLLHDTEKMWASMRTYFREIQSAGNALDPEAGKAKRNQLILGDDPSFVPDFNLPPLDFDDNGNLVLPGFDFSQRSKISSQLSPFESGGSAVNIPFVSLNVHRSSSQDSVNLVPRFGMGTQKQKEDSLFHMAFGEDDELPIADFLRIDADGNLIEEEPELPAHPAPESDDPFEASAQQEQNGVVADPVVYGDEDAAIIFGDEADADAQQDNVEVQLPSEESTTGPKTPKQRHRKIKTLAPDSATHINRIEFKQWSENYLSRTLDAKDVSCQVTITQAKKIAYHFVFGRGLGDVGLLNGIPGVSHELADFFSGASLQEMVMGNLLDDIKDNEPDRRRSASVAFGSEADDEAEDGRRVRPRMDDQDHSQQDAQFVQDDDMVIFDDLELGRDDPGSASRRSSNVPWNRPSSAIPSSIRSNKNIEVGRHAVDNSPLVRRGSILQPPSDDPKLMSDVGLPGFGLDGFGPFDEVDGAHDLSSYDEFGVAAGVSTQEANASQFMRKALDREGRNFLEFVERVAGDRGQDDALNQGQRWVEFQGLFEAQDLTRPVVAQAFLHVLTLATKNQIRVKQAGVKNNIPFGDIHLGITVPVDVVEEDNGDEEMHDVDDDDEDDDEE